MTAKVYGHGYGPCCGNHGPVTNKATPKRTPNPLRLDPTRTTTLRKQLMSEIKKRLRKLRGDINRLVIEEDAFGIKADRGASNRGSGGLSAVLAQNSGRDRTGAQGVVVNTRWRFETDADKVASYRAWLKERVDEGILEVSPGNVETPWLEPYVGAAYKKGLIRAYTDTNAARTAASTHDLSFLEGGKEQFLRDAFGGPTAQSKIKQLSTRAFAQLEGVTPAMDQEMTRILSDGLTAGTSPKVLAKQLNEAVDKLERRRALTIARTEIVHIHAEGQLDGFERLGVEELGVMAEWSTAHDDLVCPLCQPMEGVIITVKEARSMIPRHPNCRCAWIPAGVGEEKDGTTETRHSGPGQGLSPPGTLPTGKTTGQIWSSTKAAERIRASFKEEFPKLSTKEARKRTKWPGADLLTVTGKLKPSSRAFRAARAKASAGKAAAAAQAVLVAVAAKRAAREERSQNIKVGLTKRKYNISDDELFKRDDTTRISTAAIGARVRSAGLQWDPEKGDLRKLGAIRRKIEKESPTKPFLQTQMEALDAFIAAKLDKERK